MRTADLLRDPAVAKAHPLLAAATGCRIAHPVIRNRGTVCGSLAHADPAGACPPCWRCSTEASRRSSGAGALACRSLAAAELVPGPVRDLTGPRRAGRGGGKLPRLAPGTGWAMDELARRHGDYAVAGVVLTVTADGRWDSHGRPGRAIRRAHRPRSWSTSGPHWPRPVDWRATAVRRRVRRWTVPSTTWWRGVEPDRRHPRHGRLPPPPGRDAHGSEPRTGPVPGPCDGRRLRNDREVTR